MSKVLVLSLDDTPIASRCGASSGNALTDSELSLRGAYVTRGAEGDIIYPGSRDHRMKRRTKLLFLAIDIISMVTAMFLSFWLRFESFTNHSHLGYGLWLLAFSIPTTIAILWWQGLYNRTLMFTSLPDLLAVFQAASLASLAKLLFIYFQWMTFSRAVLIADWILNILLIGFSRVAPRLLSMLAGERWIRWMLPGALMKEKKTLINGAGRAGESVVRELRQDGHFQADLVDFLDDDPSKTGQFIHGLKVLGMRNQIAAITAKYGVEEVIVAISLSTGQTLREIGLACRAAGLQVKIVPGLEDMLRPPGLWDLGLSPFYRSSANLFLEKWFPFYSFRRRDTVPNYSMNGLPDGEEIPLVFFHFHQVQCQLLCYTPPSSGFWPHPGEVKFLASLESLMSPRDRQSFLPYQ